MATAHEEMQKLQIIKERNRCELIGGLYFVRGCLHLIDTENQDVKKEALRELSIMIEREEKNASR